MRINLAEGPRQISLNSASLILNCLLSNNTRLLHDPFSLFWQWYIRHLQYILCVCKWWSCACTGRCVCPVFTPTGVLSVLPLRAHTVGLSQASLLHTQIPQLNSNRTSVVRCGRQTYERLYPVMLVRPDGSTVNIRYKEPRRMLMVSTISFTLCSVSIQCFLITTDLNKI